MVRQASRWICNRKTMARYQFRFVNKSDKNTNDIEMNPRSNKEVINLSKRGNSLLRKKRYREAEKVFLEAYHMEEGNVYILVGLGNLYRELRQFDQSITNYERTLRIDPDNVFALRGIGDCFRGQQHPERAISYWMRYLEINAGDIHVIVRLADAYMKMGEHDVAESYYLDALSVQGEDKYALMGIGCLYYHSNEDDKALKYFSKLLSLDENYVAVLTMVGNIFRRRLEYKQASKYYEKAIQYEPWNTIAQYGLGHCQRGMRNLDEAIVWWSKILEKEPNNQDIHDRVGDALLTKGDLERSLEHYRKSLNIGFDPYALIGLSKIHRGMNHFEDAEICCREVLREVPGHERTLEELAEVLECMGKTDEADEIRDKLHHNYNE